MSDAMILAFGLVLVIEGIGPLLFPNRWSAYVRQMVDEGPRTLRQIGAVLVLSGIAVLWLFG